METAVTSAALLQGLLYSYVWEFFQFYAYKEL